MAGWLGWGRNGTIHIVRSSAGLGFIATVQTGQLNEDNPTRLAYFYIMTHYVLLVKEKDYFISLFLSSPVNKGAQASKQSVSSVLLEGDHLIPKVFKSH